MEKVLNILNNLCDIDEKATSIVDHTSIEKKELYKQLTEKIHKLDDSISKDTQKKIDAIQKQMNQEVEAEKNKLLTSFEEDLKKLDYAFKKNHDIYVETVFQKIINE